VLLGDSFATPDRVPDIIEVKRTEDALRENEERYRTLFNLAPVAVYSCDISGVIRDYNNRAAELWGRTGTGRYRRAILRLVQAVPPRWQFYATRAMSNGRRADWQGAGDA
jgi:PAS domain-containing protein